MNRPTDIKESEQHVTTTFTGDTTIPPFTTTTPLIEEALMRDEQRSEMYLQLTSTVVPKRKQEMLSMPLDFENNLKVDNSVDSGAYINAIAQNDLDTIKQKAPKIIFKINDPPIFQIQVANGQLEKPLAAAKLKIGLCLSD